MQHFINSLRKLVELISENNSLEPFSFDLISLASLPEEDLSTIKEETQDIQLIHINEFWDLTEIIYKNLILKTISKDLTNYFQKVQSGENETINITYQFVPWKEFVLSSKLDKEKISMRTDYAEQQIQQFLDYLRINDKSWIDDLYDFDYEFNFESEIESRFRDIAFDCWEKAKSITKNEIHSTIKEENGGSHLYNLNTGQVSGQSL